MWLRKPSVEWNRIDVEADEGNMTYPVASKANGPRIFSGTLFAYKRKVVALGIFVPIALRQRQFHRHSLVAVGRNYLTKFDATADPSWLHPAFTPGQRGRQQIPIYLRVTWPE